MSVKSFSTAVEETLGEELDGKTVEEQYVEFEIDGRTLRAFHPPPPASSSSCSPLWATASPPSSASRAS